MPLTLDTTVSGASANSYATQAEIDAYALGTAWNASWTAQASADKNALAVRATVALDSMSFLGYPADTDQALQFPRADTYHPDGTAWDTTAIPQPVKNAQMHLACWLATFALTTDPFLASGAGVRRERVGPLETEYFAPDSTDGGVFLSRVIAPMLRPHGLLNAAGTVRLTR